MSKRMTINEMRQEIDRLQARIRQIREHPRAKPGGDAFEMSYLKSNLQRVVKRYVAAKEGGKPSNRSLSSRPLA